MKTLLKLIGGLFLFLVVLLIAFAIATQFFPASYRVERSAVIDAPASAVFAKIGDLQQWKTWSVWHERDPRMSLHYSPVTTGVGAWHSWESKTEGNGKFTVSEWRQDQLVAYTLEFPDFNMQSAGRLELKPEGAATQVTWICTGTVSRNPLHRTFGLLMDKLVGPDFEGGLARLKTKVEKP